MMATLKDAGTVIADAHLRHTPSGAEGASLVSCWCGRRFDTFAHHADHAASVSLDALAANGYALVQLDFEDLWDAHQYVLDWRDSDTCDDTREHREHLKQLARRLRDAAEHAPVSLPIETPTEEGE
jgi:hypothetical protein